MLLEALFLSVHGALEFSGDGLTFRKQLIYVGDFTKGDVQFSVDEKLIDHWVKTSKQMIDRGFKIKLPVEHTFDPEKNRGTVVELSKGKDSKGRVSLFSTLTFNSIEEAKLAKSTDVSIYSPPSYTMGDGYTATRPITHVALTDYPVVPGLDPFETLAASLTEVNSMNMTELAAKLGITIPPDVTDDAGIADLIAAEFKKLQDAAGGGKQNPPNPTAASQQPGTQPTVDPAIAASMASLMKDNRSMKIDGLVSAGRMTPAEATAWKNTYVGEVVQFSNTDGFDAAYALALSRPVIIDVKSKTGSQSGSGLNPDNPLLKNAKNRAGVK